MRKQNKMMFALMAVLALAIGCGSTDKQNTELTPTPVAATPTPWVSDGFRVGNQVSDAFVDPDTYLTPKPEDVKAKGFTYDYDSLEYQLVWSDEFDYEGVPDETKWGYDTGGSGWGNNELQYYTAGDNVTVKDGYLTIEARKETMGTKEYTSTRLVSRGKGDWLYGKIEVCAKLPTGKGTWPAIWMLPTDWKYGDWPASGEIDIMEHVGYDQDKIHGTVHTASYNHSINTQKGKSVKVEGVSEEFHVYTLEWLPDKILISVDGEEYFNFEPTKYKENPTSSEWPFDQRMHLLINFAIGGNWGGARGVDDSIYPQEFVIDYVRVYQSPQISDMENKKMEDKEHE